MTSDTSPSPEGDPASTQAKSQDPVTPRAGTPPRNANAGASPKPAGAVTPPKGPDPATASPNARMTTRAATAWFATAVALVLLVLLIILILQNQDVVQVHYLGFTGSIPLGTALFIASVAGGAVVSIVGVVRLTQLRFTGRRAARRKAEQKP
jgi:uncharacterized integral membrane protein